MTKVNLMRFVAVRAPAPRADRRHLIDPPSPNDSFSDFTTSVAGADSADNAAGIAQRFMRTDAYRGATLRTSAGTEPVFRALPWLAAAVARKDEKAVRALLEKLRDPVRALEARRVGLVIELWDALIALVLVPNAPAQDAADVTEVLRVAEMERRAADPNADAAQVLAAFAATPILPGWLKHLPLPGSPLRRGLKPVGVGDLLLVDEELIGYERAQLSYVENVMETEKKQRVHRRLDRTSETYTLTTTTSEETERDLQSTERSELASEVEKTVASDMSLATGVAMSASYGPFVTVDASIDASLSSSQETATSVASTFSQDIVDRSVTRVAKTVRESATTRTLAETEETSSHGFENTTNQHVVGYYRWLEQVWRAQVKNYGRRIIMESMVQEPAALWREARKSVTARTLTREPPEPLTIDHNALGIDTYAEYVARYQATGVTPPPAFTLKVNKVFEFPDLEHQKTLDNNDWVARTTTGFIEVPTGYVATFAEADESKHAWDTGFESLRAHVGTRILNMTIGPRSAELPRIVGAVNVAIFFYDFKAATVDIGVTCERTDEMHEEWQLATFQKIVEAYNRLNDAYIAELDRTENATLVAQGALSPTAKRQVERDELQRGFINILTNQDFSTFDAVSVPNAGQPPVIAVADAIDEGRVVRFLQQAFEWTTAMTYVFYPYMWGNPDRWFEVLDQSDPDPVFDTFLKAGSARVQVPVRPGFERAVLFYLATGRIWHGGQPPVLGDPLYVPIVQEIADATGLTLADAVPYGEPWTYRLPTTLIELSTDVSDLGL